jgi:BASS family bile acid:Na+ symporter
VSWIPTATLFAMMLALGMTLRPVDFRRIATAPAAVLLGMLGQLVLLPMAAFAIARWLELSPTLAIGLVLIAACPGGVVSNALAQLARGDLALSITLTSLSSLLSFLSVPFVISLALDAFGGEERRVALSFLEMGATLFATTVLPVGIGMAFLRWRPGPAERLHRPLLHVSTGVLMLIILGLFVSLWRSRSDLSMAQLVRDGTPAVVALIATTMAAGAIGARILDLGGAIARTLTLEIGVQNINLALVVASLLGERRYAGAAIVYLPVMFGFAGGVIALGRRAGPLASCPAAAPFEGARPPPPR